MTTDNPMDSGDDPGEDAGSRGSEDRLEPTASPTFDQWMITSGHPVADLWITRLDCRLILVVVPHLQALSRLLDMLPLVEADHRVQVVFTTPATGYQWAGMEQMVQGLGGLWVSWRQARKMRFALILAACQWGIRELSGPVLLVPHGAGMIRSRIHPWGAKMPHDLHPGNLMHGDEVVPAALALAHEGELAAVRQSCPQALSRAVVAGDPCFDRMMVSRPYRSLYRDALRVREGQQLVVATTTWSSYSVFGTDPQFFARLMAELPAENYRVIGVLHPFIWLAHGRRQVLAWLAEARAAGLDIVPPEEGWRAALVSADLVIGDHGSVTHYAGGLDLPVLMSTQSLADVRPDSTAATMARLATPLDLTQRLRPQVEQAIAEHVAQRYAPIVDLITSRPGQSGAILRQTIYRLLMLAEPGHLMPISALPLPTLIP